MQEMLSFTGVIAVVTLTSSSKAVCQHIMHVRQLSYCSVKLRSSSVWTHGRSIVHRMQPRTIVLQTIVTNNRSVCPTVCPLVCLSRGLNRLHCKKTAERIQILFRLNSLVAQGTLC